MNCSVGRCYELWQGRWCLKDWRTMELHPISCPTSRTSYTKGVLTLSRMCGFGEALRGFFLFFGVLLPIHFWAVTGQLRTLY